MRTDLALAALASAAVPGMKPVAVAGIAPGDDGRDSELQSALVEDATGRRWVVRAPLTPVAGARLQRNDELVRQLSRHVPFKVPAAVGYAPLGKDGSAAVYPYVEGSPLDLRRLPAGPGLASAVGRAVAAIHNIPPGLFEEQDVPVFDATGARQRAIAEVDRAAETGRVPTGLLARWEEAFEAAPLWQFATTPVHGAFTGGSVVVAFTDEQDAATGRVVAVTDWDEAMVGDPAVDLAELWAQPSRQAWDAVLESYTLARAHRPDPYLQARARLVAEMRSLRGLARAVADDDEEGARRAVEVLRRVDRLTEADDSLVPATARTSGARTGSSAGVVPPAGEDRADQPLAPVADDRDVEPGPGMDEALVHDGPVDADEDSAHGDYVDEGQADQDQVGYHLAADGGLEDADLTMEVPPLTGQAPERHDAEDQKPSWSAEDDGDLDEWPSEDDGRVDDRMGVDALATPAGDTAADVDEVVELHELDQVDEDATIQIDLAGEAADQAGDPLAHDPVTAGDVSALPQEPEADGSAGHDAEDAREAEEPEDLEDEERLHELYGMPSPERDSDGR